MEYPYCDSCICNLFCYRKKAFIQSVSNGDHDGISVSGMRAYESDVYGTARGLYRGMEDASVYLWCDCPGGMVLRAEIHTEERNEESWKMGDCSVRRTDSILCVPNGKVFSGRCSDELLLWKRGIPGVENREEWKVKGMRTAKTGSVWRMYR